MFEHSDVIGWYFAFLELKVLCGQIGGVSPNQN